MDVGRAIEIVESLGVIEVKYKGKPVWLQNISTGSEIVQVKNIETNEEFTVNVDELEEG